jgi:hypothetical protein
LVDPAFNSTGYFARPFVGVGNAVTMRTATVCGDTMHPRSPMKSIYDENIKMFKNRLNNRPRKQLGFRRPEEEFHQLLSRVALHTFTEHIFLYSYYLKKDIAENTETSVLLWEPKL